MKTKIALLLLLATAAAAAVKPPSPADKRLIKFSWSEYQQVSPPVTAFRVYLGRAPGVYDRIIEVPYPSTSAAAEVLESGVYYATATAVNSDNVESFPAAEVKHTVSERPSAPGSLSTVNITISID